MKLKKQQVFPLLLPSMTLISKNKKKRLRINKRMIIIIMIILLLRMEL